MVGAPFLRVCSIYTNDMIRNGNIDDAAAMARIFNHYVLTSTVIFSNRQLSETDMRSKIHALRLGVDFPFLVSENAEEVDGYCYAHLWQPDPVYGRTWEVTIYLAPDACGKGIGSQLLSTLIEMSREAGAHTLISCITAGNAPCERLHRRLGFTQAGCLKSVGYKFGQYLDDALYQLPLPQ